MTTWADELERARALLAAGDYRAAAQIARRALDAYADYSDHNDDEPTSTEMAELDGFEDVLTRARHSRHTGAERV